MAVHDYIKSGDFATEKHVPVIETVDTVKAVSYTHLMQMVDVRCNLLKWARILLIRAFIKLHPAVTVII